MNISEEKAFDCQAMLTNDIDYHNSHFRDLQTMYSSKPNELKSRQSCGYL